MRILVILLMLLAAGKVATLNWLHRAASDEVIINAYRPRAMDACSRDAHRLGLTAAGEKAWLVDPAIRLEIGKPLPSVFLWQVDQPAWITSYRNPYLHLSTGPATARMRCEYDVVNDTAAASRL